jgi:hypothetical protein
LSFFLFLLIGSTLYAQSNTNLGIGVYRSVGAETNLVVVKARTGSSVRDITILSPDGSEVIMQATGTWRNGSFEVDFGRDGFDIWNIVSNREFIDGTGKIWRWVRQTF